MKCNKCGSSIPNDSNFCEICGSPVSKQAPQAPPPPQVKHSASPPEQIHHQSRKDPREEVMTVKGWIGMFIIMMIPLLNFIMLLVWALGGNVNKNKQNYIRAIIIFSIIITILAGIIALILLLISLIFGGEFLSNIPFL